MSEPFDPRRVRGHLMEMVHYRLYESALTVPALRRLRLHWADEPLVALLDNDSRVSTISRLLSDITLNLPAGRQGEALKDLFLSAPGDPARGLDALRDLVAGALLADVDHFPTVEDVAAIRLRWAVVALPTANHAREDLVRTLLKEAAACMPVDMLAHVYLDILKIILSQGATA
jgi:hypothetical protein